MTSRAPPLLALALLVAALAACSSVPMYRAPIPLPHDRQLEVGVAPHAAVSSFAAGGGGSLWLQYRTDAQLDVFGSVHAAELVRYEGGLTGPFAGGGAGVRMRMPFREDMIFAGELAVDFLEDRLRAAPVRHLSGLARLPVAQRAFEGVWLYAAPTVGLSLPLYESPQVPFFGIVEVPFGVTWTVNDVATLVVEGGAWGGSMWTPESGGYIGAAVMLHPF